MRSARVENACVEAEAQVFVEPHAEIGFPLRLSEIVERAHLGLIVRALEDLGRHAAAQLAVSRIAIPNRCELRADARRFSAVGGTTRESAWRPRPDRHEAESDAAFLAAIDIDRQRS